LAQKMQVGPCFTVGIQVHKAEVGPLLGQLGVFLTTEEARGAGHKRPGEARFGGMEKKGC
jgi:hypothetical protein